MKDIHGYHYFKRSYPVVVEKDVPIPAGYGPRTDISRSVAKLEPGESIVLKTESEIGRARRAAVREGIKITTRRSDEGWRLWRVA